MAYPHKTSCDRKAYLLSMKHKNRSAKSKFTSLSKVKLIPLKLVAGVEKFKKLEGTRYITTRTMKIDIVS
jgi:hypothetical protein